jgi:DNA-binding CsgD family transcriptional regulator
MSRVVGRVTLLTQLRKLLAGGTSVALDGPPGIGKSALLDDLESGLDALVLRAGGAASEQSMPYAALQDLLDQVPAALADAVPPVLRGYGESGLVGAPGTEELRCAVSRAFRTLLDQLTTDGRKVVLLLDDVHWLDPESAGAVGYARRRLGDRVTVVATVGPGPASHIDLSGLQVIEVPPLEAGDMIELLGRHGLPAHTAQRLHIESGGVPALALALCGAVGERPSLLGRPTPVPARIELVLRERFLSLPAGVRGTLRCAALLHRPTVRLLERVGRLDAEEEVRRAIELGLLARSDDVLRFTPAALGRVVTESTAAGCRAELHQDLAEVAPTVPEQLRHRALADPRPDADFARELATAAADAAAGGGREIATELYLLAADRAPCGLSEERVEWLVTAVETGALGNHAELVHRALVDLMAGPATPAQMVRMRVALLELAGSGVAAMDEMLTAALADAADDDRLVATVLLQRARVALMESRPTVAVRHADRAVRLLRRSGTVDELPDELAGALTVLAVATRWTGTGEHDGHLAEAFALCGPPAPGMIHVSPAYMAARFAFYDDRLDEAWASFLAMLTQVERGAGMDQVHLLRCLVEVGSRLGRCADVTAYAARAARTAEEFDLEPQTGWFICGVAELAGGDLARGRTIAQRGVAAAEEAGDTRYLQRHLLLLGQALLRSGEAEAARSALERIRRIEQAEGIADPTVNRWQAELVSCLVALGDLAAADAVLEDARRSVDGRLGTDGVSAQLDRAEAELLGARGDVEGGLVLLDRGEKACRDLGMRIDVGRILLTRAHLERRRRRAAAARELLESAECLFEALHATAWRTQVHAELARGGSVTVTGVEGLLTETELRVAAEVARGASNREIAERLYVSVKTVEATLTRIYRKLEVRSRTQLAARITASPTSG